MAKGILAAVFIWVMGVEIVAWWCLDMSVLGGESFWTFVLWCVTPASILAGIMIGRAANRARLDRREDN